jgi:hypothetical protein
LGNRLGSARITQTVAGESLLPSEFLADQFPHNPQGDPGLMGKGLGTSEPSIGRADRPGRSEHRALSIQHDEGRILIGQPAECCKRNHPVSPDHD